MDTEIEIKFFVAQEIGKSLPMVMATHKVVDVSQKRLHNVYFDTADNTLRNLDFGMRVRTSDGMSVQTIKTKGRVLGGLHQRPEYNIGIDSARPQLSLFPADIWPEGFDVEQLQQQLTPLFTTHFDRQAWLISLDDDTLVEVALDLGEVEGKYGTEAICEVELEIVKGDVAQLFNLANEIASLGEVRLANVSKAARGYRLAHGDSPAQQRPLEFIAINKKSTLDAAFHDALQAGLEHWQYHEQLFFESPSLALAKQLLQGIQLIHQAVIHYGSLAPQLLKNPWLTDLVWLENQLSGLEHSLLLGRLLDNKGHYLRKLPNQKQLLEVFKQEQKNAKSLLEIKALLTHPRYARLIVAITRCIYSRNWLSSKDTRLQLNELVAPFAVSLLDTSWLELKTLLPNSISSEQFLALKGRLQRNLLLGICLGACFEPEKRSEFRSPWSDIINGIEDLQLLALVSEQTTWMSETDRSAYLRWHKRKNSSLTETLRFSLKQAMQMQPYWKN